MLDCGAIVRKAAGQMHIPPPPGHWPAPPGRVITALVEPGEANPDDDATAMKLSCTEQSAGATVRCAVLVTDTAAEATAPSGMIAFASSRAADRLTGSDSCTLVESGPDAATCSISYQPGPDGPGRVTALVPGDGQHYYSLATRTVAPGANHLVEEREAELAGREKTPIAASGGPGVAEGGQAEGGQPHHPRRWHRRHRQKRPGHPRTADR
jgi:hypothetical protein